MVNLLISLEKCEGSSAISVGIFVKDSKVFKAQ